MDERKEFEQWYATMVYADPKIPDWFKKDGNTYEINQVEWAWQGWIARSMIMPS